MEIIIKTDKHKLTLTEDAIKDKCIAMLIERSIKRNILNPETVDLIRSFCKQVTKAYYG